MRRAMAMQIKVCQTHTNLITLVSVAGTRLSSFRKRKMATFEMYLVEDKNSRGRKIHISNYETTKQFATIF